MRLYVCNVCVNMFVGVHTHQGVISGPQAHTALSCLSYVPGLRRSYSLKRDKPYNSHIETLKGKIKIRNAGASGVRVNLEDLEADRVKSHGLKVPTLRLRACCRLPVQKKPATYYMRRSELRQAADMFNNHTLFHLLQ